MNSPATPKGHPKGLYVLFATEMWERFNYYGMRAILIFFMTDALLYSKPFSSNLYGGYTGLVYLTPLVGGYIADRYWGNRQSIIIGGLFMALAEFFLFGFASYYTELRESPDLARLLFYIGLGLMIAGNGFFKPNISSLVGQLYANGDTRKDAAYTIFYMGINVGGMLGPFICGLVGNTGNPAHFKWAFLAAGIGMLLSVITMKLLQEKYLVSHDGRPVGVIPEHMDGKNHFLKKTFSLNSVIFILAIAAAAIGLLYLHADQIVDISILLIVGLVIILVVIFSDKGLSTIERKQVGVILIVSFFVIFFWSAFEQAGASLSFFANEQTDRYIPLLNFTVPPSWFQSLNSAFVVIFAPLFAAIWLFLGKRKMEPNSPTKMAIGLLLLAIGFLVIAIGVKDPQQTKVNMMWLTSMYALHTWGELCLSPIGLSLVNKLAPIRFASLLMGVWFMANAAANVLAGKLSALYPPPGETTYFLGYSITSLYDFFMLFVVMAGVASLILFFLTRFLGRWMNESK